jgi:hypothetical protein
MTHVAFALVDKSKDINNDFWIGNSGASSHYCNNDNGLFEFKLISEKITAGNGDSMIAEKVGKLKCFVKEHNREMVPIVLEEVKYVPKPLK